MVRRHRSEAATNANLESDEDTVERRSAASDRDQGSLPFRSGRLGAGPGMSEAAAVAAPEQGTADRRLPILLAMAMFVLVVDTSIMNV